MKTRIKVKLIGDTHTFNVIENGDWIDLRTKETVVLKSPKIVNSKTSEEKNIKTINSECQLIDLGIAMELPKGYEAWVLPRSSTPKNFGIKLVNSMGIIDNSYNGDGDEWKFFAEALRDTTIVKGSRIAQFRIMLSQKATVWQKIKWLFSNGIEFVYVDCLNHNNRGGYGSTGMK